jgi:outer membrane protein OmpA-like peptidoglycan-associated protein
MTVGMYRRAALVAAGATLAVTASASSARADEAAFELERMRVTPDRMGLGSVEWADTLPSMAWDLSLWTSYSDDPLVVYAEDSDERLGELVHRRLGGALAGAIGLGRRAQVALELPLVLHQARDIGQTNLGPMALASLDGTGLSSVRVTPRFKAYRGMAAQLRVHVPIATSDFLGGGGLQVEPELLFGTRLGPTRLAANLGYRTRRSQRLLDQVVDDELTARAGVGMQVGLGELAVTVDASISAVTPLAASNQTAVEPRVLYQLVLGGRWVALAGAGVGLTQGFGNPDWRLLAGVRYLATPSGVRAELDDDFDDSDTVWAHLGVRDAGARPAAPVAAPTPTADRDRDRIADDADACDDQPEDLDGVADADGCPDLDDDADQVPDTQDACPGAAETHNGFQDQDGCPDVADRDGDGVADDADACPDVAEDRDQHDDADGCVDPDDDTDGVLDGVDACPRAAGSADNGGCPDVDGDNDAVVDRLDGCPTTAGLPAHGGCPAPQLVVLAADRLVLRDAIYFRRGKATIERRSAKLLDGIAALLAAHPERTLVRIGGHTDDVGDDAKNLRLSQQRADAVRAALIQRGVAEARLRATGHGETMPVAPGKSARSRAQNRRVEFLFGEGP